MKKVKGFGKPVVKSAVGNSATAQTALVEALSLASRHTQARNFQAAASIYQKILQNHPDHPTALHDFGVLLHMSGQPLQAVQLLHRACLSQPDWFEPHRNLAVVLASLGRSVEAIACCRQAIRLNPSDFQVQFLLGKQLANLGQQAEAESQFRTVLSLSPDFLAGHLALGAALLQQGRGQEAIDFYHGLLDTYPNHADIYSRLAQSLEREGRQEEAVEYYRQALLKLSGSGCTDDITNVHNDLGGVLKDMGRLEEAVWEHQQAIRLKPENPQSHASLGIVLLFQGNLDQAASALHSALRLQPDHSYARVGLSWMQLLREDFKEGFANYEWRLHGDYIRKLNKFPDPFWDGSSLEGKTILIVPEGGFGDTFQFIRYARLLQQRGAQVVVVCSPLLENLLVTCPGIEVLATSRKDLPSIDVQVLLLSLPHRFGTLVGTIPADIPYLWAPPTCSLPESLQEALNCEDTLKVGIVWSPSFQSLKILEEVKRYCSLAYFEPLLAGSDIQWFSLYKGECAHELLAYSEHVVDVGSLANDFGDTAWAINKLDLVISVDTSVAHLAGAMGKPVWVLLPTMPEWRWMLEREDSPWYPTMRLFRQDKAGDWSDVLERVGRALDTFVACEHASNSAI